MEQNAKNYGGDEVNSTGPVSLDPGTTDQTVITKEMLEAAARAAAPKPRFEENQLLGAMVTIDGLIEIRWRLGKQQTVTPDVPALPTFPKKFRPEHARAFRTIVSMVDRIKASPERKLPVLQSEALTLIDKQTYKDLERMGFIDTKLVQIEHKGQRQGGRVVCWVTPNGKSFERQIKLAEQQRAEAQAAEQAAAPSPQVEVPAEAQQFVDAPATPQETAAL